MTISFVIAMIAFAILFIIRFSIDEDKDG